MNLRLRTSLLVCSLALVALQFAVYAPALNNGFVHYDDNTYVYENKNIKTLNAETVAWMFARPFFRSYTPLALLSHAVDYALWGENPWGHHLTNLLLHSANVLFAFILGVILLSRYMPGRPGTGSTGALSGLSPGTVAGACIAAALYSLHPIRVESVAWISDRKDLLLASFLIPSIIAYLKYDAARGTAAAVRWFVIALVFNVLALLSKSIATVTPLLLLSLDGLLLHRGASRAEWKGLFLEKAPFFILSAGFGVLAMVAAHGSQMSDIVLHMTKMQKILMPLYTLAFYPVKHFLPTGLTPIYVGVDAGWMAAGALLTLSLVAGSVWAARRGNPGWLLAFVGYVITILPTITGLSAGIQPWADRYTYVASLGFFLLLGGGIAVLWERRSAMIRWAVAGMALLLAAVFSQMDREQIGIWKDSETLWRSAVQTTPGVPMSYDNLGVALAEKGDVDGALEMYRTAIRVQPDYADPYYNAAVAFQTKEMRDSASEYYRRALTADPEYVDAYINLGNMLANEGDRERAIALYIRALTLDKKNADAYYNLGCVLYLNGDRENALEAFKKTIILSPNYAKAYYNMGVVFVDLDKEGPAVESFLRAARLGSQDARILLTRRGYSWN